jgi:hypothetical protein
MCSTPNIKMSIARNPFHVHEYTFDEMKSEMAKVFSDFEIMADSDFISKMISYFPSDV